EQCEKPASFHPNTPKGRALLARGYHIASMPAAARKQTGLVTSRHPGAICGGACSYPRLNDLKVIRGQATAARRATGASRIGRLVSAAIVASNASAYHIQP